MFTYTRSKRIKERGSSRFINKDDQNYFLSINYNYRIIIHIKTETLGMSSDVDINDR